MIKEVLKKMGIIRKGNSNIKGVDKKTPDVAEPKKKFLENNEDMLLIQNILRN